MLPILAVAFLFCHACTKPSKKEVTKRPEIPILAWYSIPDGKFATVERYQELRDAGFTHSFAHIYSKEAALRALDLCAQVGIKSMFMCPELYDSTQQIVRQVMNHPGLGGYFLRDEPNNDALDDLGRWARRIEEIDTVHPCYLNLNPSYATCYFPTPEDYREHLRLFSEKVNLPQLSYDHYPIMKSGDSVTLREDFYLNLELIREEANRTNKPFWAFALSSAHYDYPAPTIGHLRLQQYANLAYGAQLLQYFTYWAWSDDALQAPVMMDGQRSPAYEIVREMNKEIQNRAHVFHGSKVESVYHTGSQLPNGTTKLPGLPAHFREFDTMGKGALVATLTNGSSTYIVVQNTSVNHPIDIRLQTDDDVLLILRDGSEEQASKYGPLFTLTIGDVLIFRY